jgi:uncharacterized Zn-binding protein involved in type VI secretion
MPGKSIAVEGMSMTTLSGPGPNTVAPAGQATKSVTLTVFAGGFPVAVMGTLTTPHGDPNINSVCASGASAIATAVSPTVFVEGFPVATIGSVCDCGHAILTGIPTVTVGI